MASLSKILLAACCVSIHGYAQRSDTATLIKADLQQESCACACMCSMQAPLGIMTDHIHAKGSWTVFYSYQNTQMLGAITGSSPMADNEVYSHYAMAPEKMIMQMHMFMAMYGVTEKLTVMGMAGYTISSMAMNMAAMYMPGMVMPAMTMQSSSQGLSDSRLYGLYEFYSKNRLSIIASAGVNLPTGTISATGATMLGANERLPYDMQPGTGSWAILPGITAIKGFGKISLGSEITADAKLNNNSLGYKWGNTYRANLWAGYNFLPFVTASVRAEGTVAGKISGSDAAMDNPVYQYNDPTTNTGNYGGEIIAVYGGLNFHPTGGKFRNATLLLEYGRPAFQNVNGTQLALYSNLLAALQYSF